MRFPFAFTSVILLATTTLATPLTHLTTDTVPSLPFNFTYLFTSTLSIGRPSSEITVSGGYLINEPITNGTITGPAINGTIQGGFAHPSVYDNGTLQVPAIDLYGVTSDGKSFYIHVTGVGSRAAQVNMIETNIDGGKYAALADGFVLASIHASATRTSATVEAFLVQNIVA